METMILFSLLAQLTLRKWQTDDCEMGTVRTALCRHRCRGNGAEGPEGEVSSNGTDTVLTNGNVMIRRTA